MKIHLRKTISGFEPSDDNAKKYHNKFKIGDIYHLDVGHFNDQRTAELNALYWVILGICVENNDNYINTKQLHIVIKKVLGVVEVVYNPVINAMEEFVNSTSFESIKDNKIFYQYFKDSMEFIKQYILPGVTEYELIEVACKRAPLTYNKEWINQTYKK